MHTRSGMYGLKRKGMVMETHNRGKKKKSEVIRICDDEEMAKKSSEMKKRMDVGSSKTMKKKGKLRLSDNRDEESSENPVRETRSKKKTKISQASAEENRNDEEVTGNVVNANLKKGKGKMGSKNTKSVRGKKKKAEKGKEIKKQVQGKVKTKNGKLKDWYGSRQIVLGRVVDLKFLDGAGFKNFRKWFHDQGLAIFVQTREVEYPRLVREFYANMIVVVDEEEDIPMHLNTRVNNVDLTIDSSLLSSVFSMPNSGFNEYHTHGWIKFEGFDSQTAGKLLTGRNSVPDKYKPRARELTLEFKLFFDMLFHVFFPRIGGREYVNCFDIFFMWAVATGVHLSFPHMMLQYMSEVKNSTNGSLPYGMALTKIFKHQHVDLSMETEKKCGGHTDIYSENTLDRFGYEKKEGFWVKKTITKADKKKAIAAGKQKGGETSSREGNIGLASSPSSQTQLLTISTSPSPAPAPSTLMVMAMLMKMQDNINLLMANQIPAASTSAPSTAAQELEKLKEELRLLKEQQSQTTLPSSSKACDSAPSSDEECK